MISKLVVIPPRWTQVAWTNRGKRAARAPWAYLLALLSLTGCQRSVEVRYRVTVQVTDHGVVRSGSSVWSFTLRQGMLGSYDARLKGDAVIVDLGARGSMFALLAGRSREGLPTSFDDMGLLPERLFGDIGRGRAGLLPHNRNRIDDLESIRGQVGRSAVLNCSAPTSDAGACPFLVQFADLDDPTSVRPVDPANLAIEFGDGVSLRSISVEITDQPVTRNSARDMPRYAGRPEFGKWYASLPLDDPRRIGPENFSLGAK
ncbi:hypothetical protein AB2M62_10455 [Sphingomonas sp. MMS12-HWE2-04]|uniref:hypothetical protein n=1 Tax=Sphingomonas sp. MMS12-HWE2-04 TaxID=3234199 RepID=UPI00384B2CE5